MNWVSWLKHNQFSLVHLGYKCPVNFPAHPVLTATNATLAPVIADVTAASAVVLKDRFLEGCQHLETLQREWVGYAEWVLFDFIGLLHVTSHIFNCPPFNGTSLQPVKKAETTDGSLVIQRGWLPFPMDSSYER